MDAKTFSEELDKIVAETTERIVALVHRAQESEGLDWNTDSPLSYCSDPKIEDAADNLACVGGWIHDRVKGLNRLHKKSVTKKIRKALGYTYP